MRTIIHIIPSLGYGGAEVLLKRFVGATDHEPVRHIVYALSHSDGNLLAPDGRSIFEFSIHRKPIQSLYMMIRIAKAQENVIFVGWLYIGCLFALLLSVSVSKRVVFYIHHSLTKLGVEKLHTRIIIRLLSHLSKLKRVKKIIYVSSLSKVQHEEIGYPAKKGKLILNGIDIKYLSYAAKMSSRRTRKMVIGNFGRFHPVKDHELTFRLVSEILKRGLKVELHLAGAGVHHQNVELLDLLQKYGILENTRLHGIVSEIAALYRKLDVYFLSSKAESLPNVILEAMCYGLVVASTDVGDVRSVLGKDFIEINENDLNSAADNIINEHLAGDFEKRRLRFRETLISRFDQRLQFKRLLEEIYEDEV